MKDESRAPAVSRKMVAIPPPWFLTAVCMLDEIEPGFAARTLQASNARRQVIAACLAAALNEPAVSKRSGDWPDGQEGVDIRFVPQRLGNPSRLLVGRHKKLLELAYGDCPEGFAGGVAKTGPDVADANHYLRLHAIFGAPERKNEAQYLARLPALDPLKIKLAHDLPSELLHPDLIGRLSWRELKTLRDSLPVLRSLFPDAPAEEWKESFRSLARHGKLENFATSWLKRAPLPPPPVAGDSQVWPLHSVRMMLDAARKFRNCLRDKVIESLRGESYFYESHLLDTPVMVELDREIATASWKLGGLYGRENAEVPHNVMNAVTAWLDTRGIETSGVGDRGWRALGRLWG